MVSPDPRSPSPLTRERLLRQADALEPLPATATRLVGLLSQTEWMIRDVEEVVRLDLGLTARVLRFANSAWTAHLPSVTTIRDALMRIGVGTTLSLAIAEGVRPRLLKPLPAFDLQPGRLWQHAVACALATEIVTRRSTRPIPPEAVTASLLLGLGVAATTTLFALVDAVILRPLPYDHPEQLVMVWESNVPQKRLREGPAPGNVMSDA